MKKPEKTSQGTPKALTMMRVVAHDAHQEEMQMPRLTVTLDDVAARELSDLRVDEAREIIQRAMEILPAEESMCYVRVSQSLEELGDDSPSSSAVIRQALGVYFDLLRQARTSLSLQEGYQALSMDQERQELVELMSKRAPARWDTEP